MTSTLRGLHGGTRAVDREVKCLVVDVGRGDGLDEGEEGLRISGRVMPVVPHRGPNRSALAGVTFPADVVAVQADQCCGGD